MDANDSINTVSCIGHNPVMLGEAVDMLAPADGQVYLDCTFGGGGHTRKILETADCKVVAIDRDPRAADRAEKIKSEFGDRFEFYPVNFSKLDKLQTTGYAGILFDFGVSSFQLDEADRGFSLMRDGPIDMRMDTSRGMTALELIGKSDERSLAKILREYGEEPRFMKVAKIIIEAYRSGALSGTKSLADAIAAGAPSYGRIHPATRAFQALRIAVNDELGEIESALPEAFEKLSSGGILAAISFHSLEDRIVKRFFKKMAGRPESRSDNSFADERICRGKILTNKPILPSDEEIKNNPRSRSAKLRGFRKD